MESPEFATVVVMTMAQAIVSIGSGRGKVRSGIAVVLVIARSTRLAVTGSRNSLTAIIARAANTIGYRIVCVYVHCTLFILVISHSYIHFLVEPEHVTLLLLLRNGCVQSKYDDDLRVAVSEAIYRWKWQSHVDNTVRLSQSLRMCDPY